MLKPIIKPLQRPFTMVRRNLLERRLKQLDNKIQQNKERNLPTLAEEKYREQMKNKIDWLYVQERGQPFRPEEKK